MFRLNLRHFEIELLLSFGLVKVNVVAFGVGEVELLLLGMVFGGGTERVEFFV